MDINTVLFASSIPFVLFLGIITSKEDSKEGLIRNKWILFAFFSSVFYQTAVLSYFALFQGVGFLTLNIGGVPYLMVLLADILTASLLGILAWVGGLWSAGDAKLFIAYSVLIPPAVYINSYVYPFHTGVLLTNIFIPLLVFLGIQILFKTRPKRYFEILRTIRPITIAETILYVIGLTWIVGEVIYLMGIRMSVFVQIAFMIILQLVIEKTKMNRIKVFSITACLGIIFKPEILQISTLSTILLYVLLLLIFRHFILALGTECFTRKEFIEKIKPGMFLADHFFKNDGKIVKKTGGYSQGLFKNPLNKKDTKKLQKLHSEGRIREHAVRIAKRVHFATYMFIGVLLTYLCRGSIISVVQKLIERFL